MPAKKKGPTKVKKGPPKHKMKKIQPLKKVLFCKYQKVLVAYEKLNQALIQLYGSTTNSALVFVLDFGL